MFHFPENLRIFYFDFSCTQKLLSKILNNSQILGNFVVSRFFSPDFFFNFSSDRK